MRSFRCGKYVIIAQKIKEVTKMNPQLLERIRQQKERLHKEGFEIIGVFGSFARGEEKTDSDLDLLYDIKPEFLEKYGGFSAFAQINAIRKQLSEALGKEIDLATIDHPGRTFKKFALQDIIYV